MSSPIQNAGVMRLNQMLQRIFQQQARSVAAMLSLDGEVPDLTPWVTATAEAVKPIMLQMTQNGVLQSQRRIADKLRRMGNSVAVSDGMRRHEVGNDAAFKSLRWTVQKAQQKKVEFLFNLYDPKIISAVDVATFAFCRETMQTAQSDLSTALASLRTEMRAGLAQGEAVRQLATRVRSIFADPMRAFRIAITESSRAVHTGQLISAKTAGCKKKVWVASSDACDTGGPNDEGCLGLDGKTVGIDEPFWVDPKGGPYATIVGPPLHPSCFCSMSEEFD